MKFTALGADRHRMIVVSVLSPVVKVSRLLEVVCDWLKGGRLQVLSRVSRRGWAFVNWRVKVRVKSREVEAACGGLLSAAAGWKWSGVEFELKGRAKKVAGDSREP
ncbi:hypothetical protein VTL71DRAFT_11916 [Oculimacula yallundae]|uniref:Uncharacterized protein n=1 Tax=Oculimacula yallundae TaxID=86028 RepID=A0ABR4CRD5_9HELO